jgi:hypothetical protein
LPLLEERVWFTVRNELQGDQRARGLREWVGRPATIAFPTYRFATLDSVAGLGDYLVDAQLALTRGDSAAVRATLSMVGDLRRAVPPANLTWDGLYPEAWLLAELGDAEAALSWLDPAFRSLPQAAPQVLSTPERAAALMRAMVLRSRLAVRLGDLDGARRWAKAVVILWGDADPFLQPIVSELRTLAETANGVPGSSE